MAHRKKEIDIDNIVATAVEKAATKVAEQVNQSKGIGQSLQNTVQQINGSSDSELDCPTCGANTKDHHGHKHKLKKSEDGLICTGPDCGREFILVPKENAEYVCETCGKDHVRISSTMINKKAEKDDKCLHCGDAHFKHK